MDTADEQELSVGNESHNDAYFTPQDVLCGQIIAVGTLL